MKRFIEKYLNWIILSSFIILSFIISIRHEPWADEAVAWMVARDTNFYTLFFKYLHSDGHPALWHIILKIVQFFGYEYKYFYILPILFSSIGVGIFLKNSRYPWYIKVLIPFTYFVFYQYTIVRRGYCLVFLLLSLLATVWDKRIEKTNMFTLILCLLISSESYTFMLAGGVYIFYIYEIFKSRQELDKKIQKKLLRNIIIIFLTFLITVLYVYPYSTNTAGDTARIYFFSDSFFTNYMSNNVIVKTTISMLIVIYIVGIIYKKDAENTWQTLLFLMPVLFFMLFQYQNLWHVGIVFLITLFIFWIQKKENQKEVLIFILTVCIIQIPWTIKTSIDDWKYTYCAAEEVADLIKQYDYNNLEILGLSFNESAINPYFEKNIFDNWDEEVGFFCWNLNSKFYKQKIDEEYVNEMKPDIIVASKMYGILDINELPDYETYEFEGYSYAEGTIYENQTYVVYIKRNLQKIK